MLSCSTAHDEMFLFTAIEGTTSEEKSFFNDEFKNMMFEAITSTNYPLMPKSFPIFIILNAQTKADEKIRQIIELVQPLYNDDVLMQPDNDILTIYVDHYGNVQSYISLYSSETEKVIYADGVLGENCKNFAVQLSAMGMLSFSDIEPDRFFNTFDDIRDHLLDFIMLPMVLQEFKADTLSREKFFSENYSYFTALVAYSCTPKLFRDNYLFVTHAKDDIRKDVKVFIMDSTIPYATGASYLSLDNMTNPCDNVGDYENGIPLSIFVEENFKDAAILASFMLQ